MPPATKPINDEDLVFHILNVGAGDAILVELPAANGQRSYGLIDCYNSTKTRKYFQQLRTVRPGKSNFKFICATHPHLDHIAGINYFLKTKKYQPEEFWDSGFRHNSTNYLTLLQTLQANPNIKLYRVSSGMERYYGQVQVTALAPSIALRNRYATYGVDVNNASIVLRFENHRDDILLMRSLEYTGGFSEMAIRDAGSAVAILAGDAEFDSWSHIVQEFPRLEKTDAHRPLVTKMVNYLNCSLLKVAHHGSMHSAPLDIYEMMSPQLAVISAQQTMSILNTGGRVLERNLFPHDTTILALEECGAEIGTTDGSYESQMDANGQEIRPTWKDPGSIIVVVPPKGSPRWGKLKDTTTNMIPTPPTHV